MRFYQSRAFTLMEVLMGISIFSVALFLVMNLISLQKSMLWNVEKKRRLADLLELNVFEIKGRPSHLLPLPGKCIARIYSLAGEFVSESEGAAADAVCTEPTPKDLGIKIILLTSTLPSIKATFVPATHLKLPKYVPTLREIRLRGGMLDETSQNYELSLTTYRR